MSGTRTVSLPFGEFTSSIARCAQFFCFCAGLLVVASVCVLSGDPFAHHGVSHGRNSSDCRHVCAHFVGHSPLSSVPGLSFFAHSGEVFCLPVFMPQAKLTQSLALERESCVPSVYSCLRGSSPLNRAPACCAMPVLAFEVFIGASSPLSRLVSFGSCCFPVWRGDPMHKHTLTTLLLVSWSLRSRLQLQFFGSRHLQPPGSLAWKPVPQNSLLMWREAGCEAAWCLSVMQSSQKFTNMHWSILRCATHTSAVKPSRTRPLKSGWVFEHRHRAA